jgi:sec-independent protein translocase protein TatA
MGNLGATEIMLILLVVVLLFGGRKIPELMKGIGQGMKEFKKASTLDDEPEKVSNEPKAEENKK